MAPAGFVLHEFTGGSVLVPECVVPTLPTRFPFHVARLETMKRLLKFGDTYFDIGTELGWLAPLFAQWVGAESMCLFEPSEDMWPNIRATWQANELSMPKSTYWGFVGDVVREGKTDEIIYGRKRDWNKRDGWPGVAFDGPLLSQPVYRNFDECPYHRCTTLDALVETTNIIPKAIGMNIEGAEAIVLKGGQRTFAQHHPLVWVGMHVMSDTLRLKHNMTQGSLVSLMKNCGYVAEFLETSYSEEWWLFT